jgi:hypothetical protein
MLEIIDTVSFSVDGSTLHLETVEGSTIDISMHKLSLSNFLNYSDDQKISWDLENAVLGYVRLDLFLVIPHHAISGAAWIPLATMPIDVPWQRSLLKFFVERSRELVQRTLPFGETDSETL